MYISLLMVFMLPMGQVQLSFRESISKIAYRTLTNANCPTVIGSWIPDCGLWKPIPGLKTSWIKDFIDFEIRERKYLVFIKETLFVTDVHVFPAVLIGSNVVVAICSHFHQPFASTAFREMLAIREVSGEVRAYEKSSFTVVQPCNFGTETVAINPFTLENEMVPPGLLKAITDLEQLGNDTLCRYYSFAQHEDEEKAELGPQAMAFVTMYFIPKHAICDNQPKLANSICGLLLDPDVKFCSLAPGGIVFCNGKLLGIGRTYCDPKKMSMQLLSAKNVSVGRPVRLLTISLSEMKYWKSLGIDKLEDLEKPYLSCSTRLNGANYIGLHVGFITSFGILKYTYSDNHL